MSTTYNITGKSAQRDGECVVCREWVDASRHWEAILLRKRGASKGGWAVAHSYCLGGKFGGIGTPRWRGPASVEVKKERA